MTEQQHSNLSDRVEAALHAVRDPAADLTVFEDDFVHDIVVDGGDVTIETEMDALDDSTATEVTQAMLRAVDDVDGVASVHVESVTPASEGTSGVEAFDHVVAVASAKGGVGKSTTATHLACALAEDADVALFDADLHGPNVPELLGVSGPVYSDDEGDPLPVQAGGMDVMSVGLMGDSDPLAWRGAMAHEALEDLFTNTAWRNDDILVVDLPPGTGDIVLTTLQEIRVDGVVVVTTPFHASVSDTSKTVELFRDNDVPVLGTVVNMAEYVCDCCGEPNDLFEEDTVSELDAPILAELPFSHDFQGTPVPGSVPAAMDGLGEAVTDALATTHQIDVPEHAVDIRGCPPQERKNRVRERFEGLAGGGPFVLVSDRDPTPVREFLATLADCPVDEVTPFEVRRATPADWVLETEKPERE
jgi:ATP-binding protein involved in chromosome partitioning